MSHRETFYIQCDCNWCDFMAKGYGRGDNAADQAVDAATEAYLRHVKDRGGIIDISTVEGLEAALRIIEQREGVTMEIVYRRTNGQNV